MLVSLHDLFAFGNPTSCIAHTKGNKRCGNHSSQENLKSAKEIWDAIAAGANDAYVNKKMDELAAHCLCKTQHQGQTAKIAEIWKTQYHLLRRCHQAGFQMDLSRNTATDTTLADQVKIEMFTELIRHRQEYDDITQSFARKQSQPDVEMIDAF